MLSLASEKTKKRMYQKARSILMTKVLSCKDYAFNNGILMQYQQQELQSRFGKEGGFLSL
jgi:hypothetical protein